MKLSHLWAITVLTLMASFLWAGCCGGPDDLVAGRSALLTGVEGSGNQSPVVVFVQMIADSPTQGHIEGLASGDTVEIFSDVTFVWTGYDPDGEVMGWESRFDAENEWRAHVRNDTTRTETALGSGSHALAVRAIDDMGAPSNMPAICMAISNFAPVTVLDRESVVARLPRPWIAADDTLEVWHINPTTRAQQDTIPLNSRVSMCWAGTDIDGPIHTYYYHFTPQVEGQVRHGLEYAEALAPTEPPTEPPAVPTGPVQYYPPPSCASPADVLGQSSPLGSPGSLFHVHGVDIHGRAQTDLDTLRLFVNFRPRVAWQDSGPVVVVIEEVNQFAYAGDDLDSDPELLLFSWQLDDQLPTGFQPVPTDERFVEHVFESPVDVGIHRFIITSKDGEDGLPSDSDTLFVQVVAPGPASVVRKIVVAH